MKFTGCASSFSVVIEAWAFELLKLFGTYDKSSRLIITELQTSAQLFWSPGTAPCSFPTPLHHFQSVNVNPFMCAFCPRDVVLTLQPSFSMAVQHGAYPTIRPIAPPDWNSSSSCLEGHVIFSFSSKRCARNAQKQ